MVIKGAVKSYDNEGRPMYALVADEGDAVIVVTLDAPKFFISIVLFDENNNPRPHIISTCYKAKKK